MKLTITTKEVSEAEGIHLRTAQRKIKEAKRKFGLKRKDCLSILQYAEYHNQDFEMLFLAVNSNGAKEFMKKYKERK